MSNIRDETLRLIIQTAGDQEILATSKLLSGLGTTAGMAAGPAKELVDEIVALNTATKQTDALISLKAALSETTTQLEAAKIKAAELQTQFSATESPTKALVTSFEAANKSVSSLTQSTFRQHEQIGLLSGSLKQQGVDTDHLAQSQGVLRDRITDVSGKIVNLAQVRR